MSDRNFERLSENADDSESQSPAERPFQPTHDAFGAEERSAEQYEARLYDSDETVTHYIASFSGGIPRPENPIDTDELLDEYVENLKNRLRLLGLRDPEIIDEEYTRTLLDAGYLDVDSVEDLYYWVWDYARTELGPFTRVKPNFLLEAADKIDSSVLQINQDKEAMTNLIALGVSADELFESSHGNHKRNIRRLSWLLTKEDVLHDKATGLKISTAKGERTNLKDLAKLAAEALREAQERLASINLETLETSIDQIKIKSEIDRLKHIIALSHSIEFTTGEN